MLVGASPNCCFYRRALYSSVASGRGGSSRQQLESLITKYRKVAEEKRIRRYNEENTKAEFIEPLFESLGWDLRNKDQKDEVTREEKISKGRVDYGFRINGISKFLLEAKALKANLNNPVFIEQAIKYSWNKGCTWAVLTDFESIRIFNAEWLTSNYFENHFKTIQYSEYLDKFDQLNLLSKESFENGLLDKLAEDWGKKAKRTPVDKQLLVDFTRFREMLSKNISRISLNKKITKDELDESVQRILDRLIFIRFCEDRELDEKMLITIPRESDGRTGRQSIKNLRGVFSYYDKHYDSNIFSKHLCDYLEIDDQILDEVIQGLYFSKDSMIHYDFSVIEADVLGNIYEQYLGHILKQTAKRTTLTISQIHRKEHGIYYTPTRIVDYIIKHTLGILLEEKEVERHIIRILDPACGSGSFLIKAFDVFNEYYLRHHIDGYYQTQLDTSVENGTYTRRLRILQDHIFGVDIDKQAVEVAQLNLLLKVAEKGRRLPLLQQNIKQGNSLIDMSLDPEDRAFNWKQEFNGIFSSAGGFDVIIGNPPYVFGGTAGIRDEQKIFFQHNYISAKRKLNLFSLFIEKSINLLRNGGLMAFIIPNTLLRVTSYEEIRKYILDRTKIIQIVNLEKGVFEKVTASTIIIILQKETNKHLIKNNQLKVIDGLNGPSKTKSQSEFINNMHIFDLGLSNVADHAFFDKLDFGSVKLGTICKEMIFGVVITKNKDDVISNAKLNGKYKKFLEGRDIGRYRINFADKYLLYERSMLHRPRTPEIFESKEKILVQRISGGRRPLKATYDNEQYYNKESINNIILSDRNFDAKYILALLNSSLLNLYYSMKFTNASELTVNVSKAYLSQLPIKNISSLEQQPIIKLVERMLLLNKRLNHIGDKMTDERVQIENQIIETDKQIDDIVYRLYDITEAERRIIEGSTGDIQIAAHRMNTIADYS